MLTTARRVLVHTQRGSSSCHYMRCNAASTPSFAPRYAPTRARGAPCHRLPCGPPAVAVVGYGVGDHQVPQPQALHLVPQRYAGAHRVVVLPLDAGVVSPVGNDLGTAGEMGRDHVDGGAG